MRRIEFLERWISAKNPFREVGSLIGVGNARGPGIVESGGPATGESAGPI